MHTIRFPNWDAVLNRRRTVFHLPVEKVHDPFRTGELLLGTSVRGGEYALLEVLSVSEGALRSFLCEDEYEKTGYTPDVFARTWADIHGMDPNPRVVRVELRMLKQAMERMTQPCSGSEGP